MSTTIAQTKIPSRHSINVEGFGKTLAYGSINYEIQVYKYLHAGIGIGRQFSSGSSVKKDLAIYFLLMSKETSGFNFILGVDSYKFNSAGTSGSSQFESVPFIGIGGQKSFDGIFLRFNVYGMAIPASNYLPSFIPWAGISIGYRFQKRIKESMNE